MSPDRTTKLAAPALSILLALGAGACSREARSPAGLAESGSVGLALTVAPGVTLGSVHYMMGGPRGYSASGTIDVGQSSTVSTVLGNIPAGTGYTIDLGGTGSDRVTTCAGSSAFDVVAHTTTPVSVHLTCHEPARSGSVLVNGQINVCARLDGIDANPAEVLVGHTLALGGAAVDSDAGPSPLAYHWTVSGGTLDSATAASPTLTCTTPGPVTVTLTVSDGDAACAAATATAQVTCTSTVPDCTDAHLCALYGVGTIPASAEDGVVSNRPLEDGIPNNRVGALGSAIAYTGVGSRFVMTPDRGPNAGLDSFDERYYLVDLSLASGTVTPRIVGGATLNRAPGVTFNGLGSRFDATNSPAGSRRLDSEGVRVTPKGTFWVSDEYGPFLYEFSPAGDRLRFITLPSKFLIAHPAANDAELPPVNTSGRVVNRGMEGLAISPDGHRLYGMMQNGIIQDGELDANNKRVGTHNRIIEFDADNGVPLREFLYVLDNPAYGCNELLAINDHQFLAIERDGNGGTGAAFKKLMLVDITGATDISGMPALSPSTGSVPGVTPVQKRVFLDLLAPALGLAGPSFPEKVEGLAFGPDLPDGRHTLVVTNDNDFIDANPSNLYVFAISPAALPGFQRQLATFPDQCATVSCPAAAACHVPRMCNPSTGACSDILAAAGTAAGTNVTGDCRKSQCDGAGNVVSVVDDTDAPNDGNQCTTDACQSGTPVFTPAPVNTTCSQNGGSVCSATGACVACNSASQCPGTDSECKVRACVANTCGFNFAPAGQTLAAQTAGDCHTLQCDGGGGTTSVVDDSDRPVDGNQCTADVCSGGVPSNPPIAAGTPCSGGVCNGAAMCTGCVTAADCPGTGTACAFPTCTAGACGIGFAAAGTATPAQTAGDCKRNVCDGAGNVTAVNDDGDAPASTSQCRTPVCSNGAVGSTPVAYGTSCTEGGGQICDGAGTCGAQYFQVLRVDGTSSAASAATLVKFTTSGAVSPASTLTLPLTQSGSASSEGGIALSGNQKYLAVAGYNASAGTASIKNTTSGATNRMCVLVDASMTVVSSSRFSSAFSADNVRGAVPADDGAGCWLAGPGNNVAAGSGVWWNLTGQVGGEVQLNSAESRWLGVFGGQLYGSSKTGPVGVFTVGSGTPRTGGQAVTALPMMTTASAFGFVLLDRDSSVAGLDTLYVADDSATASGGGIQKWTFNGTSWSKAATFSAVSSGSALGYRGLAGAVINGQVVLMGTTTEASANRVVVFVDTGSGAPTGTVIATSPSTANYRGVALQPHD